MEIYFELIKKYFEKIDEKEEKEKKSQKFFLFQIFFDLFIQKKEYSVKEKYLLIKNIITNIFLTKEDKEDFLTIFYFIQKSYFALVRFKFLLLFKKSKKIVENDLSLNPISEKDKDVLIIFQNKNKYLFQIRDLLHLITNCLGHSSNFFSHPIIIKNPYNNLIFSKSTLYNIYFFMRFKTLHFSEIFHKFFLSNFHLKEFYEKNSYLLRNYAMDDYLKNTSAEYLKNDIDDMIDEFNQKYKLNKIIVDPDFPDNKYLEIMKPYLKLYNIANYSLLYSDKVNAKKKLFRKLLKFYYFNPIFGRKITKINYPLNKKLDKQNCRIETIFIDEHISFYENGIEKENNNNDFLNSHSVFKEDSENED
jgi:hypothetical protein